MSEDPVAYFITFSTYGARLHGDARGTSDDSHNAYNTPLLGYDERRWEAERALMRDGPFVLDSAGRRVVLEAIHDAVSFREWTLHAVSVRTNHIHVVVTASGRPEPVLTKLKARATRALRDTGLTGRNQPVWAHHGSTRWLWDETALVAAIDYVNHAQGVELDAVQQALDMPAQPGDPDVGLCFHCAHAQIVQSGRRSRFWLCELSRLDLPYAKYPRLPVLRCRGFANGAESSA
jgi:REP element-mobilizing transposase RayT